MGRENPRQVSPAGKPSITARQTAKSKGKLPIHTGHGKEYGQVSSATSFSGGGNALDNGATRKGGVSVGGGHGTEYDQVSSRG